jgi:bacterioferritin (cytochrome b1)
MGASKVLPVLNRLYQTLSRSLPVYLADARPFARGESQPLKDELARVAADQLALADRVALRIVELADHPEPGGFPMQFTSVHDLEIDFLLRRVIEIQRRDIEALKECAVALADQPQLQSLAEEAIGNAEGHLEIMEEMMHAD